MDLYLGKTQEQFKVYNIKAQKGHKKLWHVPYKLIKNYA